MRKRYYFILVVIFALIFSYSLQSNILAEGNIDIVIAHTEGESDNWMQDPISSFIKTFQFHVETLSNGEIKVRSNPDGQLGDLESLMEQTSRGVIESMEGAKPGHLSVYDEAFQLLELPFMFSNLQVAQKVLEGPYGEYLNERLIEKANLRVLAWMPSGFRSLTNNVRPIKEPADMVGLDMRAMDVPIHINMMEDMGANSTPISWGELYTALQMGVADGQDNPPFLIEISSVYEVQDYLTLSNHILNVAGYFMNEDFYQSLSPEHQNIINFAAQEAQSVLIGVLKGKDILSLDYLSNHLEIYSPSDEELDKFIEAARMPAIERMKERVGEEEINMLLEAIEAAEKELEN